MANRVAASSQVPAGPGAPASSGEDSASAPLRAERDALAVRVNDLGKPITPRIAYHGPSRDGLSFLLDLGRFERGSESETQLTVELPDFRLRFDYPPGDLLRCDKAD